MKGISSPDVVFHRLKSLQKFTYQCSASSTAAEIEQVCIHDSGKGVGDNN